MTCEVLIIVRKSFSSPWLAVIDQLGSRVCKAGQEVAELGGVTGACGWMAITPS